MYKLGKMCVVSMHDMMPKTTVSANVSYRIQNINMEGVSSLASGHLSDSQRN